MTTIADSCRFRGMPFHQTARSLVTLKRGLYALQPVNNAVKNFVSVGAAGGARVAEDQALR